MKEADKEWEMDVCNSLSQIHRRRRTLKRLDMDRLLTAAGSQVWQACRPEGAGQHRFTQGDGAGGVGRRSKCQQKRVLEGEGVGDRKQNKRQTQEIVIQVDASMCDATTRQAAIYT